MHEVSIVEGLIGIIEDAAMKNGISKVSEVSLRIGAMRQVVPDALVFAFEVLGKGTVADGAAISIKEVPTRARCRECAMEFMVEDFCFICTSCDSGDVEVVEGKELYIDSLEGE